LERTFDDGEMKFRHNLENFFTKTKGNWRLPACEVRCHAELALRASERRSDGGFRNPLPLPQCQVQPASVNQVRCDGWMPINTAEQSVMDADKHRMREAACLKKGCCYYPHGVAPSTHYCVYRPRRQKASPTEHFVFSPFCKMPQAGSHTHSASHHVDICTHKSGSVEEVELAKAACKCMRHCTRNDETPSTDITCGVAAHPNPKLFKAIEMFGDWHLVFSVMDIVHIFESMVSWDSYFHEVDKQLGNACVNGNECKIMVRTGEVSYEPVRLPTCMKQCCDAVDELFSEPVSTNVCLLADGNPCVYTEISGEFPFLTRVPASTFASELCDCFKNCIKRGSSLFPIVVCPSDMQVVPPVNKWQQRLQFWFDMNFTKSAAVRLEGAPIWHTSNNPTAFPTSAPVVQHVASGDDDMDDDQAKSSEGAGDGEILVPPPAESLVPPPAEPNDISVAGTTIASPTGGGCIASVKSACSGKIGRECVLCAGGLDDCAGRSTASITCGWQQKAECRQLVASCQSKRTAAGCMACAGQQRSALRASSCNLLTIASICQKQSSCKQQLDEAQPDRIQDGWSCLEGAIQHLKSTRVNACTMQELGAICMSAEDWASVKDQVQEEFAQVECKRKLEQSKFDKVARGPMDWACAQALLIMRSGPAQLDSYCSPQQVAARCTSQQTYPIGGVHKLGWHKKISAALANWLHKRKRSASP
jgi:hypothetical protein